MGEVGYIAYIDEAGDFGLNKVVPNARRSASEWLIVSGVVIRSSNEPNVINWLREMRRNARNTQSPDLHFRKLGNRQKKIICSAVSALDLRIFVVISNKQNMQRHRNSAAARTSNTRAWFYWWLCRLLLERITEFCERRNNLDSTSGQKLRIEFSRRKDLKYSEFTDYMTKLWLQGRERAFLNKRLPRWSVVDLKQTLQYDHQTRAGLQIADVVASAFYQAVNRDNVAECVSDYAELLRPRIWSKGSVSSIWLDEGFTVWPFSLRGSRLTEPQKRIFRFYGYPDDRW
jgi:hypothetical protein